MTHAYRLAALLSAVFAFAVVAPDDAVAQSNDTIQPNDPELVPPATNDPTERAKAFYMRGRKNYDLGRFRRAIALYERAYEELPDAAFLFNIAQAYRQLDECKDAQFFYKRYLSVAKDVTAAQKKEIEGHIAALTECVKKQEDIRNRPPGGTIVDVKGTWRIVVDDVAAIREAAAKMGCGDDDPRAEQAVVALVDALAMSELALGEQAMPVYSHVTCSQVDRPGEPFAEQNFLFTEKPKKRKKKRKKK